jgi:selenocysteine lyase/cysteine desulfurase
MKKTDLATEFPLDTNLVHLNHAGVGPWPRGTQEIVCQFAQENMLHGSSNYRQWERTESELRTLAAQLINAPAPQNIALLKNTSEALSLVAYGLNWEPGDEVIIPAGEFPSNRIVWESLTERYGVTVTIVSHETGGSLEEDIINATSDKTRLISASSVSYASGYRMDLNKIGAHCRSNNILFCIDAIQSLGAIPFDVQSCHADFMAADGHKWMLAPEGVAIFYVNPDRINDIQLRQFGWHMVEHVGDYTRDDWEKATTARRFECGSPNNMGIHALKQSLELLLSYGIDHIYCDIMEHCRHIETQLLKIGCRILSAQDKDKRSGIVTFSHPSINSEELYKHLMSNQILCAYRGGGVRFSPHFYTSRSCIDRAIALTRSYILTQPE